MQLSFRMHACPATADHYPSFAHSLAYEDIEKEACFILGLLAVKPEYQTRIVACGALAGLVPLLKEHKLGATTKLQPGSGGAARRAADAITNLAHENSEIKNMVRRRANRPFTIPTISHDLGQDHNPPLQELGLFPNSRIATAGPRTGRHSPAGQSARGTGSESSAGSSG